MNIKIKSLAALFAASTLLVACVQQPAVQSDTMKVTDNGSGTYVGIAGSDISPNTLAAIATKLCESTGKTKATNVKYSPRSDGTADVAWTCV